MEADGSVREAAMPWYDFIWNTGENGNAAHMAEHGVDIADAESVVCHPLEVCRSRSTGRPIAIGWSSDGRLIAVVYEQLDPVTVYPVTAFEVEE